MTNKLEAASQPKAVDASAVDEPPASNERKLTGPVAILIFWFCVAYTTMHLVSLNLYPIETWAFRAIHVAGALMIGFALMSALAPRGETTATPSKQFTWTITGLGVISALLALSAFGTMLYAYYLTQFGGMRFPPNHLWDFVNKPLVASTVLAIITGWLDRGTGRKIPIHDWVLVVNSLTVVLYLLMFISILQSRAGVMPTQADYHVTLAGIFLILELTRRVAGMALIVIAGLFILYGFAGPYLPGFLYHGGYRVERFITYLYTDNGILGPTTAVSSTYIMLFIAFAAFLQASKVGDYFVNFAFAAAGHLRGGPAKVAVFASGLMGMINGTSAGNVVATGSLTIPLMKRVGYSPRMAASVEAAASTGGQIMPPIMGAGAFIMAEVTGIPYTDLIVAAIIPAVFYFASVFFIVDLEACKNNMKGLPRSELPRFDQLVKQVYLFLPIIILVGSLFLGYSVIRAGTMALVSALVVSWLTPHRMGPKGVVQALDLSARMAIQLIAVCACAGIIVGVIGLTGVGLRFSSMLLSIAEQSQLIALVFAMMISILLGMGMPTTAAYAVAASVVAPGLIQLGVQPLVAHFFVFYYAVLSAITPPVALAAYAGAALAGSEPMRTSVTSFQVGLSAFIVPFLFFYSPGLLMQGEWIIIARNVVTGLVGIYLLSATVVGYLGGRINAPLRLLTLVAAVSMIAGGWVTDLLGLVLGGAILLWQIKGRKLLGKEV